MKMSKRLLALVVGGALAVSMLAGCGGAPSSAPAPSAPDASSVAAADEHQPVELTMWVTSRNQDEFLDQREAAFLEAHPWITLNKVVKDGDPANEFYQAVAAGTAPDFINGSFTMMAKYIAAGIVAPLNDYLDAWDEAQYLDKAYLDMFTKDGKVYGIASEVTPMLFGYNKALFAAAGFENPPATWEEALEMARALNDPDNQVAGYATLASEWTEWFFQYYVWQAGGDLTKENADGTAELTFTDPAAIEAAKYYQQLSADKLLQTDRTLKFNDLLEQFSQGKIAMMPFATDWVMDVANRGMDLDDLGLCVPPAGPSGKSATAIAGGSYVINASVSKEKQDAAWEYISWQMSKEELTLGYQHKASKGAIAPITIARTDMSITDFTDFPEDWAPVLASIGEIGRLEFYGKADFGAYVDRAVQKILADPNADPEKELGDAQALAEKEALQAFNEANKTA